MSDSKYLWQFITLFGAILTVPYAFAFDRLGVTIVDLFQLIGGICFTGAFIAISNFRGKPTT